MSLLDAFASEMVTADLVTRDEGEYIADGTWEQESEMPTSIQIITPQPVNEKELQMLTDGEYTRDFRKSWTKIPTDTRCYLVDSDQIDYDGKMYKVVQVDDRNVLGGFYRFVMREITDNA